MSSAPAESVRKQNQIIITMRTSAGDERSNTTHNAHKNIK